MITSCNVQLTGKPGGTSAGHFPTFENTDVFAIFADNSTIQPKFEGLLA